MSKKPTPDPAPYVPLDMTRSFSPAPYGDGPFLGNPLALPLAKRVEISDYIRQHPQADGFLSIAQVATLDALCPQLSLNMEVQSCQDRE